jgi:hypothetical protein
MRLPERVFEQKILKGNQHEWHFQRPAGHSGRNPHSRRHLAYPRGTRLSLRCQQHGARVVGGFPMSENPDRTKTHIENAKETPGGHLHIGRGGYTLHTGSWQVSGYDCEAMKAACIAAALPVIDSRNIPFEAAARLSVRGPMIAVDKAPDPSPWNPFSYARLGVVAAAYRRADAEVYNIAKSDLDESNFPDLPAGPLKTVIDGWFDYVLNSDF